MTRHKIENRDCRFDVVGIKGDPSEPKQWEIQLVQRLPALTALKNTSLAG